MPKAAATFALVLAPRESGESAGAWLRRALRAEILQGRLKPGARLPATRELAGQYRLSRGTIVSAFDDLKSQGYLEGTVGSGTYVNRVLPEELLTVRARRNDRPTVRPSDRRLSAFAERARMLSGYHLNATRAFRANVPALDLFPTTLWAQITARRTRRATPQLLLGSDVQGYPPLRQALADYLTSSRGVQCAPEQVMVVSGMQEALDLVARLALDPGDRVCIEDPGYDGATLAFESQGAVVTPVPLDEEGMRVPPANLRGVKLAYVTPGHQFPTGIGMSLKRRLELLDWARRSGALILEDDYDSEYRYAGRPLPALQGLDRHRLVLFGGTLGKVLFPALRLGYLVVPPDLVDRFAAVKSVSSRHGPLLDQAVLCDFIIEGHFGRHIRRMREIYAGRLDALVRAAELKLSGLLDISGVEAGLQTAGWLREGLDGERAAAAAAKRNVEVIPLSRYSRGPVEREGLHLGFAAVDEQEIRRGVTDLAAALDKL